MSRQLASVVVPHEYGLDGPGKLLIGGKICAELLGKLLCDLDSMKVGTAFEGMRWSAWQLQCNMEDSEHAG